MLIKKGIKIKVICGKDKGKDGEVIEVLRHKDLAKVKGINLIKKHIDKYKVGQRIMCEVSKVVEYGVFCKFWVAVSIPNSRA